MEKTTINTDIDSITMKISSDMRDFLADSADVLLTDNGFTITADDFFIDCLTDFDEDDNIELDVHKMNTFTRGEENRIVSFDTLTSSIEFMKTMV